MSENIPVGNNSSDFEKFIKPILMSELNELNSLKEKRSVKLNYKDLVTCNYINVKGIQCTNKCVSREDTDKPMCHSHIKCKPVHQCVYVYQDDNNEMIQCENLTRSKTEYCNLHATQIKSKVTSKIYYQQNRERILKEKKLNNLSKRTERIINELNNILNTE
jgi:hypothetical protein